MQEMSEKMIEFLDNKSIEDGLIRNLISCFITRHTELYGKIVSFENLISRLNTNLGSIKSGVKKDDEIFISFFVVLYSK